VERLDYVIVEKPDYVATDTQDYVAIERLDHVSSQDFAASVTKTTMYGAVMRDT